MEESRLKGDTLYSCFIDFKKAFDTVPRDTLWERMECIGVPESLRFAVFRLYEKVRCQLKCKEGMSQEFCSNMGVKQGCPLSPTLFGLCIDRLEELIKETVEERELTDPSLGKYVILLLLYADDVVFFTKDEGKMQYMMDTLSDFCSESGLAVNVTKTKLMVIKTNQPSRPPHITYGGQHIEVVQSFKYLGIEVPCNHRWGNCVQRRLDAGWGKYYQFENDCNNSDTRRWHIRNMIFGAYVIQTVLYGVEVWGGTISPSTWNDIEKMQKSFIKRHLGIKTTTPYSLMLLETGCIPIEMHALKRVFRYIMKINSMGDGRIPKKAWVESNKLQKTNKSKILASGWALDIRKWFKRWEVETYLDCTLEEGDEDAFHHHLLDALHKKWRTAKCRDKFEYYCSFINPAYWDTYARKEPTTQPYISSPIPMHKRRSLASLRTRSHQLEIEKGMWGKGHGEMKVPRENRICRFCDLRVAETEEHMVITCPQYAQIRKEFSSLLHEHNGLTDLLAKAPPLPLSTYVFKLFKHRDSLESVK